ncbi:MAG: hypothetical protein CSA35_03710 [Dethiosulfovibrio peptidovorans]|nr:MAG: hypothetical protein CSA35_03710 [Dethiosulfovibrio peptidovorans]
MRRSAFSLVEVLIAVVILTICLFGLATVPVVTTRLMVNDLEQERATAVAMARLEEVEPQSLTGGSISGSERGYAWTRTVTPQGADLWTVSMDVAWQGVRGPKTLSLGRDYGPASVREGVAPW